ncbi:MAG: hypothetical protein Q7S74_00340 [Nanoarchaeota archaeon]|nr:hypothetical protein [Nanoarchaeota archaeon]
MKWKEFFKPTIIKLILFFILPTFYVQTGARFCSTCLPPPSFCSCPQPHLPVPLPFAILSYTKYFLQNNIALSLCIGIIASYLLASLIIYFYKSVKSY